MDLGIRGRTALVTAAGGGLGAVIAATLADEGADLLLFSRSEPRLAAVAAEIADDHGVGVRTVVGDLTRRDDIEELARVLSRGSGVLDIAVLVTGRPPTPLRSTLEETDATRWQSAYENQLASLVDTANALTPLLLAGDRGRLVTITSAHAKEPTPGHALSAVFRAGATAYVKSLAREVAAYGVTANCVAPALIDSSHRVGSAAYTEAQAEERAALAPLGRMGTPAEVAAAVAFLVSEQAGFITGTTLTVDGGLGGSLF